MRTRITVRHLIAIEEGNESDLPEVFYVRGFLKKYAEAVGLSPKDVADAYRAAPIPTTAQPTMGASAGPILYYALILGLIGGILALAWHFQPKPIVVADVSPSPTATATPGPTSVPSVEPAATAAAPATGAASPLASSRPSAKPSAKASAKPSARPSTAPAAVPSAAATTAAASAAPVNAPSAPASPKASAKPGTVTVELTIEQRSWVEVRVDGEGQYEGLLYPKTHRKFKGKNVMVSAGNAGGVRVTVNGKDQGHLGPHGEVVAKTYKP
jgi:cytoskeletal protein RodZ